MVIEKDIFRPLFTIKGMISTVSGMKPSLLFISCKLVSN